MKRKPSEVDAAQLKARELYSAAWDDFCGSFWDDDRMEAEVHMKKIRQRLYDEFDVDLGQNYLAILPGYMEYMHLYRSENKRFNWE